MTTRHKMPSERGWLIEQHYSALDQPRVVYWMPDVSKIVYGSWTDDPNKAIRFARREDAETFIRACQFDAKAEEHMWVTE